MSVFTQAEIDYLKNQRLCRLATVDSKDQPHVVPFAFRYNPYFETIDIGGHDFASRKKFRDVQQNSKVALVIDDIASVNPWVVRGIEIRGEAEILKNGGKDILASFDPEMFRIKPKRVISWGIN